ncbi:DUF2867 domain-containing protein [Kordia sp.]|uniref:DUF2867 domain-containing protein n=1 Tax=Kordia sp. TaxID=1965332 RepID=UPI003D27B693
MSNVKEEAVFISEKAKQLFPKIDFSDTFSTTNQENSIEEITNQIFNTAPKWVEFLFKMRNSIVKFFGLKTGIPDDYSEDFKVGGYVKFFKIYTITDNEVILGANDSHLNFRAIVHNTNTPMYNIKVTTLVEYNNVKGKIYMAIVKPFHRLVVKRMVEQAFYQSTKNN